MPRRRVSKSDAAKLAAIVDLAFEDVGKRAFHLAIKAAADGLATTTSCRDWFDSGTENDLPDREARRFAAQLALVVERCAIECCNKLLADDRARRYVSRSLWADRPQSARTARKAKIDKATSLLTPVLLSLPGAGTKELVRLWEGAGVLRSRETSNGELEYVVVDPDEPDLEVHVFSSASLDSKVSRLLRSMASQSPLEWIPRRGKPGPQKRRRRVLRGAVPD